MPAPSDISATPGRPRCSVIVCSLNGEKVLPACLGSLAALASGPVTFEVIVVDNGSTDSTPEIVRRDYPSARLLQTGRNLGFAGGNNVGIQAAQGEILILLNDDTEVPEGWLEAIAAPFDREPRIGVVGCKLLYPDRKTVQHAGGFLLPNASTGHVGYGCPDDGRWDEGRCFTYLTGAALALRREALAEVGLLDPAFFPIYFEEVDLQKRLADAGWQCWYEPAAWLVHFESQSQGVASPRFVYRYTRNRIRYIAMHGMPTGWRKGLAEEARLVRYMTRDGHLWSILKAYGVGLAHWPMWRLDRHRRRTIPPLEG